MEIAQRWIHGNARHLTLVLLTYVIFSLNLTEGTSFQRQDVQEKLLLRVNESINEANRRVHAFSETKVVVTDWAHTDNLGQEGTNFHGVTMMRSLFDFVPSLENVLLKWSRGIWRSEWGLKKNINSEYNGTYTAVNAIQSDEEWSWFLTAISQIFSCGLSAFIPQGGSTFRQMQGKITHGPDGMLYLAMDESACVDNVEAWLSLQPCSLRGQGKMTDGGYKDVDHTGYASLLAELFPHSLYHTLVFSAKRLSKNHLELIFQAEIVFPVSIWQYHGTHTVRACPASSTAHVDGIASKILDGQHEFVLNKQSKLIESKWTGEKQAATHTHTPNVKTFIRGNPVHGAQIGIVLTLEPKQGRYILQLVIPRQHFHIYTSSLSCDGGWRCQMRNDSDSLLYKTSASQLYDTHFRRLELVVDALTPNESKLGITFQATMAVPSLAHFYSDGYRLAWSICAFLFAAQPGIANEDVKSSPQLETVRLSHIQCGGYWMPIPDESTIYTMFFFMSSVVISFVGANLSILCRNRV